MHVSLPIFADTQLSEDGKVHMHDARTTAALQCHVVGFDEETPTDCILTNKNPASWIAIGVAHGLHNCHIWKLLCAGMVNGPGARPVDRKNKAEGMEEKG